MAIELTDHFVTQVLVAQCLAGLLVMIFILTTIIHLEQALVYLMFHLFSHILILVGQMLLNRVLIVSFLGLVILASGVSSWAVVADHRQASVVGE